MIVELTMQDMEAPDVIPPDNNMHIVMFYGTTCGPCLYTRPHYEEVARKFIEFGAPIKFYRINAWEPAEQKTYCTEKWGVQGVPHFKAFYKSQMLLEKIGGGDEPVLHKFVHDNIDEAFKKYGDRL